MILACCVCAAGRVDEAIEMARRAVHQPGGSLPTLGDAAGGRGATSRELMDRAARDYVPTSHLVFTAEAAEQREEALVLARGG
jgi:hypothetical protein